MITTRAMPALLPAHHRRVAEATIKNDFADALATRCTSSRYSSSTSDAAASFIVDFHGVPLGAGPGTMDTNVSPLVHW